MARHDERPASAPRRYRCAGCKGAITVYVRATVACSRCGRIMREVREAPPLANDAAAAA